MDGIHPSQHNHRSTARTGHAQRMLMQGAAIASLLIILSGSQVLAGSRQLNTFGFFDIEWEQGDSGPAAERGTFDQHHLTLICQARLSDSALILCETAYEHAPTHGASAGTGKIYLPKAYYEVMRSDALKFRAGKFLPPFGIYNERHDATPTLLPTVLPRSVYGKHPNLSGALTDSLGQKVRAYPRFSTGLWVLGNFYSRNWELEYHFYLSNGRGDTPHEQDDNSNKGLGGRCVVTLPSGPRIGLSYYQDHNGAVANAEQSALGVDLEYGRGDLIVEAGLIWPQFEILDEAGRSSGESRAPRGSYLFLGYSIAGGVTPFAYYDLYDPDLDAGSDGERDLVFGVNHPVAENVFIKAEIHSYSFEMEERESYRRFITSLAVAF